jgi:eukaryotic-like serine/threonine-protein kinase
MIESSFRVQPSDIIAGRFRVVRAIGSGGMADVFEVFDELLKEHLALKVIRTGCSGDDRRRQVIARFEREVQLAKKVTHPNVCRIYDIGMDWHFPGEPVIFFTMELLAGESLAQRLQRGRMNVAEALPIARQMAAGLAAAHQAGVIHRDFKSANVVLVAGGQSGDLRAVVTDFGLARPTETVPAGSLATEALEIVGTPDYMAPEQLLGQPITAATDVYAFGVVLYEMVSGCLPFTGDTAFARAVARIHTRPVPVRQLVPHLDPALAAVIERCLALEPAARFAGPQDAVAALEPVTKTRLPRTLLIAAFALALIVLLTYAGWRLRSSPPAATPASQRPAAAARGTGSIEAYDLYVRGRAAVRDHRDLAQINAAIDLYQQSLKKDPGFALAFAGLADAFMVMYKETKDDVWATKALHAAQQGVGAASDLAEVHLALGGVYDGTGKTEAAIAEISRGIALRPDFDEGPQRLGRVYLRAGRKQEALDNLQRAVALNPNSWLNHYFLGTAHDRFGDNEKALAEYRRVVEIEPATYYGYERIGTVKFRQGQYEECIAWYRKALEIRPHAVVYHNLGSAYYCLRRYVDAEKAFERALAMDPASGFTAGDLADTYRMNGHPEKARKAFDQAIALLYKELAVDPRDAFRLGSLAVYTAKKGDHARALELIRQARSIDAENVELLYNEARVHSLAGRQADAAASLRAAFAKGYSPARALTEPDFDSLRNSLEFQKLTREYGARS